MLPAITASAPPRATQDAAPCAKVLAQLPVTLTGLDARVVHTTPDTPNVVAWGDPAVVLRCGVARPKSLTPDSGAQFFSALGAQGPYFDVSSDGNTSNTYTFIDRAAYIAVTIPAKYSSKPLPTLARAIAKALPAVCAVDASAPAKDRCTRRP